MRRTVLQDSQQALGFLQAQMSTIEAEAIRIQYPDVQYPGLVPIVTGGDAWTKSITYYSIDSYGKAEWLHAQANNMPVADIDLGKHEVGVSMAGIGYRYNTEELMQASRVGINLTAERPAAARRVYEEFIDDCVITGNVEKGWYGIINQPGGLVTAVDAAAVGDINGGTDSPYWAHKTGTQVIADFNALITGMWTASKNIELADTICLPYEALLLLAQTKMEDIEMTLLEWVLKHNVYTLQTNQQLTVRGIRGLETAGDSNTGRMVAYRRDPQILRFLLPMPHQFLGVWPESPLTFLVPGIFRVGGLEIRRPGAMRYMDKIIAAPA